MMTFNEYTNARRSRKWGISVDHEAIAEFEAAQPKSCPKCWAYVFDPYGWNWVIHDVDGCAGKRHNAKVSGAGTASAGLTGSAAGGLEKGEAMDMAWADKQLPPGVTRQDVCIWTQDSDGPWCGSCGVMWEFIDGGPKDNETHFCPRCGGVLLAEPFAEDETPNAALRGAEGVPLESTVMQQTED